MSPDSQVRHPDPTNQPAKTSERVNPDRHDSLEEFLLYLRHVFVYDHAATLIGKQHQVADVGCGAGYGTRLLSQGCASILGFDVSGEVVDRANSRYATEGCAFQLYDGNTLPVPDGVFDAAVSVQVIEHITDDIRFVSEACRVLKEGGLFVVATPNRLHRLRPGEKPWNRYHVREYDPETLTALLGSVFSSVAMHGIEGNEAIQRIELARVRGIRRLLSVDPFRLQRLLPESWFRWIRATVKTLAGGGRRVETAPWKDQYQVSDYHLVEVPREETLDLLAVCRKGGGGTRPRG